MNEILNFFGLVFGSMGLPVGAKLTATLFVPDGYGVAYQDTNGAWWRQQLMKNEDGTTFFDDNGRPVPEMVQITLP